MHNNISSIQHNIPSIQPIGTLPGHSHQKEISSLPAAAEGFDAKSPPAKQRRRSLSQMASKIIHHGNTSPEKSPPQSPSNISSLKTMEKPSTLAFEMKSKNGILKFYTFDFTKNVRFVAAGSTSLVFKIGSVERKSNGEPSKKVIFKIGKDNGQCAEELERSNICINILNKDKKLLRGIPKAPHATRELNLEAMTSIYLHIPEDIRNKVKFSALSTTAVIETEYDNSLTGVLKDTTEKSRQKIGMDLFHGYLSLTENRLIHLDLKTDNILVMLSTMECVYADFGNAVFIDEIESNPDLLKILSWTNSKVLENDANRLAAARNKVIDKPKNSEEEAANKEHVQECVSIAKQIMAFGFGVMLFDLYSNGQDEIVFEHLNCPYIARQKNAEGNEVFVAAQNKYAYIRHDKKSDDIEPPAFNDRAFTENTPLKVRELIAGLLEVDPAKRLTVEKAFVQYKEAYYPRKLTN